MNSTLDTRVNKKNVLYLEGERQSCRLFILRYDKCELALSGRTDELNKGVRAVDLDALAVANSWSKFMKRKKNWEKEDFNKLGQ